MKNRVTNLLGIKYPIIQGGMVWASGWELVSAVSNAGGLGLLGSGSMPADVLRQHIRKCKQATSNPFGVNVPIMYKNSSETMKVILQENVPIVFTSAGAPNIWTQTLQDHGIKVAHVVSSLKFALKAQQAGTDLIVAEGFEAGGHNGKEETTTMTLIPLLKEHISIPIIAAGGIATGRGMFAAMSLGAEGVQIGSRFVATHEASVHQKFKDLILNAKEGDTILTLKELSPVRLLKNPFFDKIAQLYEKQQATPDNLRTLLGKGRTKIGMFDGDLEQGELEIGQVCSIIHSIESVDTIFSEILKDFDQVRQQMNSMVF